MTAVKILQLFPFSSIIEWNSVRSTILIIVLVALGSIGALIKCLFINYILKHAPKNRPINTFVLKDQILMLVTTSVLGLGNLICLSLGLSIHDLFGDEGCFVFFVSFVSFGTSLYTSSFSMSLFRWICIIHLEQAYIIGIERVKRFVYFVEGIITILASLFLALIYAYGSAHLSMSFCYNKSKTFLQMLAEHNNDTDVGYVALTIMPIFLQFLGMIEFAMYAILFKKLQAHDQGMKDSISKEQLQNRKRTNVITLSGQAWGFLVEIIANITCQIAVNLDMGSVFLQPQMAPFYMVMLSTAVSIGQFLTSPDMRKFYLEKPK